MDELTRRVEDFGHRMGVNWDDDHLGLLLVRTKSRKRRRRAIRIGAGLTAAGLMLFFLWPLLPRVGPSSTVEDTAGHPAIVSSSPVTSPPELTPRPDADGGRVIRFEDGSSATPVGARTELVVGEVTVARTRLTLNQGAARFVIAPAPSREFLVVAAGVRVRALGTRFSVERRGARVAVEVTEGRVEVTWPGGSTELSAGRSGLFPREPDRVEPKRAHSRRRRRLPTDDERSGSIASVKAASKAPSPPQDTLRPVPPTRAPDPVEAHLAAADAARADGRPEVALVHLEAISESHAADPRAPLAAFTAARLLLGLEQTELAAAAFRRARRLDPEGELAEDAWAREVEAHLSGGRRDEAIRVARAYLAAHPEGRHAERLRLPK